MDHLKIPGGHEWALDNGATLQVLNLERTKTGRIFCLMKVLADGGLLGIGKVELTSSESCKRFAEGLARRNGNDTGAWLDHLDSITGALDEYHRINTERFEPLDLSVLEEPDPLTFVWQGLMPTGFASNLYGDGGASKTTTAQALAICVTKGWPFLGQDTIKGPVLHLDWELNQDRMLESLYKIARGFGMASPPVIHYQAMTDPLALHLDDLLEWCHRKKPALIIVDSLGPAAAADPNDAEKFIGLMNNLRKLETSSLVIDHQSKGAGQSYASKRAIGSGYKDFLVRGGFQLELASGEPGRASIILRHGKHNFTWKRDPIAYHVLYGEGTIKFELADINDPEFQDVETLPTDQRIERFLNETAGATKEKLMEGLDINNQRTFDNAMSKARKRGRIDTSRVANTQARWYFIKA